LACENARYACTSLVAGDSCIPKRCSFARCTFLAIRRSTTSKGVNNAHVPQALRDLLQRLVGRDRDTAGKQFLRVIELLKEHRLALLSELDPGEDPGRRAGCAA
jgi:hypothetical protein